MQTNVPLSHITLPHGEFKTPLFLPDGTQGVVRTVDAQDLIGCGIQGIQMNVFHLMQHPGTTTIQSLGGLHKMAGWDRPITTDSGGFQVYSLIRQNPKMGSLNENGASFKVAGKTKRKFNLTPEKSIRLQFSYGSDILFCLDDCTHVDDSMEEQRKAVRRTLKWAARCKAEFDKLLESSKREGDDRPKLFAVIQGGGDRDLRRQCAEELLEMGFDGFGYGGWPLDADNNLLVDMIGYVRELVPLEYPIHALGIGHPESISTCVEMGYNVFDSTLATRDARRGRLYVYTTDPQGARLRSDFFSYLYAQDKKHVKTQYPISEYCDCATCSRYSVGYLHHLFKLNEVLYQRLATIHNLRFMTQLMANLRGEHVR